MTVSAVPHNGKEKVHLHLAISAPTVVQHDLLNAALGKPYSWPMSEYLFENLREALREYLPSDEDYEKVFDHFEYILALTFADESHNAQWCPLGLFVAWSCSPPAVVAKVREEVDRLGESSPLLQGGFFSGSVERFTAAERAVAAFIDRDPHCRYL